MSQPVPKQTNADREYILANLPDGTRRVQVRAGTGATEYKRPEDVNVVSDEIMMNNAGLPIVMRGKPGRKKKPLKALTPQIQQVANARQDHFDTDPLLVQIRDEPDADPAMDAVLNGLAEEAASIEFDRLEAQRHGEETSNLASKRARILKALGDLMLKRKALQKTLGMDLDSPEFKAVFELTLETFKKAMGDAGCRPEQIETVFTNLGVKFDNDWEQEAKLRAREASRQ